jgi:hypothetical protein
MVVTYRSIIYQKRFANIWWALFSHPPRRPPQQEMIEDGNETTYTNTNTAIAMGSPDGGSQDDRRGLLRGNGMFAATHREGWQNVVDWGKQQIQRFGNSGCPLLLYNAHIIWSCRAMEQVYNNNDGGPWKYSRCLLCLVTLAISLELVLSHIIVKATVRRQQQLEQPTIDNLGELQPDFNGPMDIGVPYLQQLRRRIENRPMGTMTSLTVGLVVLFRFHYMRLPLAILPFFTDRLLVQYPGVTYILCLGILVALARPYHPMGVLSGFLVSIFWVGFRLDSLANASNGNWVVLLVGILTFLSLKGQYPSLFPCIQYVSWYDPELATAARTSDPVEQPLSWCFRPDLVDADEENSSADDGIDDDGIDRVEEAMLEFTRIRSDSDNQEAIVDPSLLEQGRRPRRTRIQSQRP